MTVRAMHSLATRRASLAYGTAPLLPLPACGERVGVRGRLHESVRQD
jgi:hypothetical protein